MAQGETVFDLKFPPGLDEFKKPWEHGATLLLNVELRHRLCIIRLVRNQFGNYDVIRYFPTFQNDGWCVSVDANNVRTIDEALKTFQMMAN